MICNSKKTEKTIVIYLAYLYTLIRDATIDQAQSTLSSQI